MVKLRRIVRASRIPAAALIWAIALCSTSPAQILHQDQEIHVHKLPMLMAHTDDPTDVLLTSLDTIIHDRAICCGRDSALEDRAQAADPKSLKDVAGKLQGRHLLSDGRPINVRATFLPPSKVSAGDLVAAMLDQRAALLEWNSHVYVVHGIVFVWTANYSEEGSGGTSALIRKLLLWDTRYSDARREVVFNRETEDAGNVEGLLFVDWTKQ